MGEEQHAAAVEQVIERTTFPDGPVVERIVRHDVIASKQSSVGDLLSRLWNGAPRAPLTEPPAPTQPAFHWYINTGSPDFAYVELLECLAGGLHSQMEWTVFGSGESPTPWIRYKTKVGSVVVAVDLLASPPERPHSVLLRVSGPLTKRQRRDLADLLAERVSAVTTLTHAF